MERQVQQVQVVEEVAVVLEEGEPWQREAVLREEKWHGQIDFRPGGWHSFSAESEEEPLGGWEENWCLWVEANLQPRKGDCRVRLKRYVGKELNNENVVIS